MKKHINLALHVVFTGVPLAIAATIILIGMHSILEGSPGSEKNLILLLGIPAILLGYWIEPKFLVNASQKKSYYWMIITGVLFFLLAFSFMWVDSPYIGHILVNVSMAFACGFLTFWTRNFLRHDRRRLAGNRESQGS